MFPVYYTAWNTSTNAPAAGDAANHTVTLLVDGAAVAGLTPAELANGSYKVEPSDAQLPAGSRFKLHGSSATADVYLFGSDGVRPEPMRGTDGASTHDPAAIRTELATELGRIDTPVSTRSSHAAPDLSLLDAAVSTRAAPGAAMALTGAERTALAAALEAAIINDLDGQAVMQAIADLIASDMTTADLTVQAIAAAARDAFLNRVLPGNHDTPDTPGKLLQDGATAANLAIVDAVADAIKAVTDKLNTALQADGLGGFQYTAEALEHGPAAAGGGDATQAKQDAILAAAAAMQGAGFDTALASLAAIRTRGDTAWSGAAGSGDTAVDHDTGGADALRVVDGGGSGIDNVNIRAYLKTDYDASNYIIKGAAVTRSDGRWAAPMYLNAGLTYTLTFESSGAYVIAAQEVTV